MAAIDVHGLHKSYGTAAAVRGIDFTVEDGEIVAMLGPNGAGKTTTVEILEGFRSRSGGEVSVLGIDPAGGGRRLRQRIGIVLQECGIDNYLSASEILRQHAGYYPAPRPIDEVLAVVGLSDKANARVKTLSGGQQRRLDLALALVGDPDLIFLDEPTTGFDPSARRQSWETVHNLGRLGKTILLTTHSMEEAQELADRVIVINDGTIVAEGSPESIGGRDRAAAHIRFELPPGTAVGELPVPASLTADGTVLISTTEPTSTLKPLVDWALARGHQLPGLSVTRPTLEEAYLRLTTEETPGKAQ